MSLYLADQKLGSHSNPESSSHKFMLKGRQSGGMHRGHAWVFRAESYETMLAWFEDIKNLTEKTGEERTAFIRQHARSVSAGSNKAQSFSDDGVMDEDEADKVPYSATPSQIDQPFEEEKLAERPNPGGRFPSALTIDRNSQVPLSPSSNSSSGDRDIIAAAGALPGSNEAYGHSGAQAQISNHNTITKDTYGSTEEPLQKDTYIPIKKTKEDYGHAMNPDSLPADSALTTIAATTASTSTGNEYNSNPVQAEGVSSDGPGAVSYGAPQPEQQSGNNVPHAYFHPPARHDSKYGDWMGPAAAGAGGITAGGAAVAAYKQHQEKKKELESQKAPEQNKLDQQSSLAQPENPSQTQTQTQATTAEKEPQAQPTGPISASPRNTSTQALPPNVAWATTSTSSVVSPSQLSQSEDITPSINSAAGNTDPFFTKGLSPVTEQGDPTTIRDPGAPIKELAAATSSPMTAGRPPLESHASVTTISDLHIPGEFPRRQGGEN